MVKYILLALLLIGCADREHSLINPVFSPYVASFKTDLETANMHPTFDVGIQFRDLPSNEGGTCQRGIGQIYIDAATWDRASEGRKKLIIYHELGHCVLYLGHDARTEDFGAFVARPYSVMSPILPTETQLSYDPSYVQELISRMF